MACLAETGQVTVWDMPTGATPKGKRELDRYRVLSGLGALPDGPVWMEQVASMPGQGVSSSFRFGEGVGILKMAVAACGRELRMVPPSVWKRHFGLVFPKGTPKASVKNASRMMACSRFPQMVEQLARVKDEGRAEALLIALYGREVSA